MSIVLRVRNLAAMLCSEKGLYLVAFNLFQWERRSLNHSVVLCRNREGPFCHCHFMELESGKWGRQFRFTKKQSMCLWECGPPQPARAQRTSACPRPTQQGRSQTTGPKRQPAKWTSLSLWPYLHDLELLRNKRSEKTAYVYNLISNPFSYSSSKLPCQAY